MAANELRRMCVCVSSIPGMLVEEAIWRSEPKGDLVGQGEYSSTQLLIS